MAIGMMTARVRRKQWGVSNGPGKTRQHTVVCGMRMAVVWEFDRPWTKERVRGREMAKGKLFINQPLGVMMSILQWLCSRKRKLMTDSNSDAIVECVLLVLQEPPAESVSSQDASESGMPVGQYGLQHDPDVVLPMGSDNNRSNLL
jgi:hypothetical protein